MVAGLGGTAACTPLKDPPAQLRDKSDLDCALDHYFAFPEYRENGVTREEIVRYVEVWSWGDHITAAKRQFDERLKTGKLVQAGTNSYGNALYRRP